MSVTNKSVKSKAADENPVVYDFTDYREFLKAYYSYQKKKNPAFSYRLFASKAKINSSGFYKNVVDGKRSLGRSLIIRFAEAMSLRKKELDYFEAMVYFNEAKTLEEKGVFFARMMACGKANVYQIGKTQFEFYSKWYYSAVRELVGILHFKNDFAQLARTLVPSIRPEQAEKAIRVLEDLKLIAKDSSGIYRQSHNDISTGSEVQSLQVANYQIACMELAKQAIDNHESSMRDMSTLTLSLSEEGFQLFKEEIIFFRKKLLALEKNFPKPDRVYQLNTQFFPLSKIPMREKP